LAPGKSGCLIRLKGNKKVPIEIRLPAIDADFEAGAIASWHKAVGDSIEKGEVIVDVETDKAVVEVEASDSGILGSIVVPAGTEDVAVNTVIGVLLEAGETIGDIGGAEPALKQDTSLAPVEDVSQAISNEEAATDVAASVMTATAADGHLFASPLARRIAEQHEIDLTRIKGRGPNGRILKADVEQALQDGKSPLAAPAPAVAEAPRGAFTTIPNSKVRKVIARRLTEAKQQIPHFYLTVDCELDALLGSRQQINERHSTNGSNIKVSVNDFIVKAAALALLDVPAANASWTEDAIRRYDDIDVAVAVATANGLITPVVRQADKKSLDDISIEVKNLASRANNGQLQPDEYKGGGFTISNLGMYGIKEFSAIINPPQSCILAIGAGEKRPIVREESLAIATMMSCTLSVDHRSVDGAVGAEFLQAFKQYIEEPALLLHG
jgi:pyruvate dehydrogenase E2 component (dihydrolipoamide acetyltransferase)